MGPIVFSVILNTTCPKCPPAHACTLGGLSALLSPDLVIGATVPCMHYQWGFATDIPTHTVSATHIHDGRVEVELTFRMLHTSMLIVLTIRRIHSRLCHLSLTQPSTHHLFWLRRWHVL